MTRTFAIVILCLVLVEAKARSHAGVADLIKDIEDLRNTIDELKKESNEQRTQIDGLKATVDMLEGRNSPLSRSKRAYRRRKPLPAVAFQATLTHSRVVYQRAKAIPFNNVITASGPEYNKDTGVFTCQFPGIYVFHFSVVGDRDNSLESAIQVNGHSKVVGVSKEGNQGGSSAVLKLHPGDKVRVVIRWPLGSSAIKGENKTNFSGYILRHGRKHTS